jgi:hypothetical protein
MTRHGVTVTVTGIAEPWPGPRSARATAPAGPAHGVSNPRRSIWQQATRTVTRMAWRAWCVRDWPVMLRRCAVPHMMRAAAGLTRSHSDRDCDPGAQAPPSQRPPLVPRSTLRRADSDSVRQASRVKSRAAGKLNSVGLRKSDYLKIIMNGVGHWHWQPRRRGSEPVRGRRLGGAWSRRPGPSL